MGVSYDISTGRWNVTKEKTNYSETYTPLKTDNDTSRPTNLPTRHIDNPTWVNWKAANRRIETDGSQDARVVIRGFYALYGGRVPADWEVESWRNAAINNGWKPGTPFGGQVLRDIERGFINSQEYANFQAALEVNKQRNIDNAELNRQAAERNTRNAEANKKSQQTAEENKKLNTENKAKNNLYDQVVKVASSTTGGDYLAQRDQLTTTGLINAGLSQRDAQDILASVKEQFKSFYLTKKLILWDTGLGVQPPYADYLINELGVKPDAVVGVFDPRYYSEQNPQLKAAWEEAVAKDDLDIIARYAGPDNFYWQHYSSVGRLQGLRGNPKENTAQANSYLEKGPTNAEIQQIRDLQLGVDQDSIAKRLLNITEVSNEWTKARQGDPYWTALAKEKYLDVDKAEDFAVLFRLSERDEDKQIALNYNINAGSGITELEQAIDEAIGAKSQVDVKKFAALNQNILKETIDQMKKVKAEQEMLSFYKGFQGFNEIFNINQTMANSILGDTGVGGILSFTSAGKAEEDLVGALGNVTGMRSNVAYNWQSWFDKAIKDKYGIDYSIFEPLEEKKDVIDAFTSELTVGKVWDEATGQFNEDFLKRSGFETTQSLIDFLQKQGGEGTTILDVIKGDPGDGARTTLVPIRSRLEADIKILDEQKDRQLALAYTAGDVTEAMNIEAQFARDYIDEYLLPRFNTARSMDEFVEYLDVRQEEQNPFQTQDTYNAVKLLSDKYTQKYLDDIKLEGGRTFDPNFYFDPVTDTYDPERYKEQKNTVAKDWELAKAGNSYWAAQAYRFGIDINNKAAFARMHFEVKGQGKGFDPAEDIVNASKVKDFIYDTVLPVLKEESLKSDPVFGQFITPEEFADEVLRGLDPADTPEEWKEVLQRYGLQDFAGDIQELKEYIIEALRTGSAQQIREEIKYLNEKRQRPTQEILGVTYIERPEDYKDEMAKPTTELYAVFQKAGFQGTEDEFYDNFFSDLDRSEQITLTKAGRDQALEAYGLDLSDPFASLGTVESFFPEYQEEADKESKEESPAEKFTSYFKIGLDDEEEDVEYMSDAGKKFLGEFTSMFKGL